MRPRGGGALPAVDYEERLVDAMAALLVRDAGAFDVIVTTNMFGDILSDLASEISGSLGLAASLNAGAAHAMAQAQHGSAPDIAGQDLANPSSLIVSAAMLLAWLGERRHGARLRGPPQHRGRARCAVAARNRTPDLGGPLGTKAFGARDRGDGGGGSAETWPGNARRPAPVVPSGACPKVITEGTLAYGLVFPSGFKAVLIGSAGPITAGVRALAEKLGPVDVAIVAYQVHAVADTQIGYTWPFIELFKPKLFLPAHHDASPPAWVDLGLEPLFDRIRANMPNTAFLAPLYRSPICVAGAGSDKGEVVSFKP